MQNTAAAPGPAAIANQIGEHLFGSPGEPQEQTFAGDLASFSGTYSGPGRGALLTATVAVEDGELNLTIQARGNSGPAQTPTYVGRNTFAQGDIRYMFEMSAGQPGASVLRMDSPSGHYILRSLDD